MDNKQLFERVVEDGGFTYDLTNRQLVTSGYAVSVLKGREVVIERAVFTANDIYEYVWQNWKELSEEGNCFGAWEDDDKVYLDISTVTYNRENAYALAVANNQIAFYDLRRGCPVLE
jgi:hypothetical protein